MKNIAFFSIKGGTGRSLGLVNVAAYLAKKGKKIGCVDFDFMAPGLSKLFNVPDEFLEDKSSIVDLLLDFGNISLLNKAMIDVGPFIKVENNKIFLIPAKTENMKKYQDLARMDVFKVRTMNIFIDTYLNPFINIKMLDYLFIDAKSGLSEESMCALTLARKNLAIFSRIDPQSQNVTLHFLKLLGEYKYKYKIILVISNIPKGNAEFNTGDIKVKISKDAISYIKNFEEKLKTCNTKISCIIPFDERLLINPFIMTIDEPESETANSFKYLAEIIEKLPED